MPHQQSHAVEMPMYLGAGRGRHLRIALTYRLAGYLLAVLILAGTGVIVSTQEAGLSGGVAFGVACGVLMFAGVPWAVGFIKKRQANQRLRLDGGRLTVLGGLPRVAGAFNLDGAHVEVLLDGGRKSSESGRKAPRRGYTLASERGYLVGRGPVQRVFDHFVPYHPVLIVYRDGDQVALAVELADTVGGRLRDAAEIHRIERTLSTVMDPAAQLAAGRLRTVARWGVLPHITDADPDAIPVTPVDYPHAVPVLPTQVRAGTPSPQIVLPPA